MTRRRMCPVCGTRWVLRLNRGAAHRPWHDDPRCADCRTAAAGEPDSGAAPFAVEVTPDVFAAVAAAEPAPHPVLASISALLTADPVGRVREPSADRGYGTYPAIRDCPGCGTEWTLLVDRPARQSRRNATCGSCRTAAAQQASRLALPVGDLPGPWAADGLCAQVDPEIFHPEKGANSAAAKAICQRCPVLGECRTWALETAQAHGIWGGLSAHERMRILGRRAS